MRFFGLSATEFTLLFASAAFLAVVFYLLSFRRRTVLMATEPIWRLVLGRRRTPFRKLLALLLQLLILFLLTLALADPRLTSQDAEPPVAAVVVVDVSASMGALEPEGTRLEQAIGLVDQLAEALGPRDRMMLVAMEDGCRPLTGWLTDAEQIRQAARALAPVAVGEDFEAAVHFAANALRAEQDAEPVQQRVVVISDHFHPAPGLPVELVQVSVGSPGENLAVTAFEVRRRGGAARGHEVFAEVRNYGSRDRATRLSIHTDKRLLGEDLLEVPAGQSRSRSYFLEPIEADRIMATITGQSGGLQADRFSLDDRAFALLPERQAHRVVLVTTGNLYLEMALRLDPGIDLRVVPPGSWPVAAGGYDAVVFDGLCPAVATAAIYFAPQPGSGCPFASGASVAFPELLPLRGDHPITEGLTLIDVQIQQAQRLSPVPGDVELLADTGGPLVLARQLADQKLLAFGFDVARSDLPLRIAFPLMMHNCLRWFFGADEDLGADLATVGSLARLPDWAGPAAVIEDPQGRRVSSLRLGGRSLLKLRWPGFYQIGLGKRSAVVAANMQSAQESSLSGDRSPTADRLVWTGGAAPGQLVAGFDKEEVPEPPLQWPLLLLAIAWLLVFDWIFFCFRILF